MKMYDNWESLRKSVKNCNKCKLCETRNNIVFGEGDIHAEIMMIGEGPGSDEDKTGRPFIGRAGQLLSSVLQDLGIKREDIYITNIIKCRPPQNRNPEEEEMDSCINYLRNQVILIKPKIIVLLGSVALKKILGKEFTITTSRGKWVEMKGIKYMPTWHPAALLRDESKKADLVRDLQLVKDELEKIKS